MTDGDFEWPATIDELYGDLSQVRAERFLIQQYEEEDLIADIRLGLTNGLTSPALVPRPGEPIDELVIDQSKTIQSVALRMRTRYDNWTYFSAI